MPPETAAVDAASYRSAGEAANKRFWFGEVTGVNRRRRAPSKRGPSPACSNPQATAWRGWSAGCRKRLRSESVLRALQPLRARPPLRRC